MPNIRSLKVDGVPVKTDARIAPGSSLGNSQEAFIPCKARIGFKDAVVTVTDSGGANGGFGSKAIVTLPAADVMVLACLADLAVVAAAGIGASSTVKFAVGTAAEATNDTLDSTQADIIASSNAVLTSSAGAVHATSAAGVDAIDARAGNVQLFLNVGVADAGISANSSVTLNGYITLIYLNLK